MRRWAVALITLIALRYHYWRITQTLVFELSATAALIGAFYAVELFMTYRNFRRWRVCVSTSDRAPEVAAHLRWYGAANQAPLIDILIPTYDESRAILKMTILAASHQDYPRYRVWVLDDGRRPWLSELCGELGVNYVTRNERTHFKAGNLNHGLKTVFEGSEQPEYVAVLDADCIAYPAFLERTLALMHDARVGLVQTPQHFYSPDPIQYAFNAHAAWPDSWRLIDLAYIWMDNRGGAGCLGTAFLARSEALRSVRGIPTDSLLENGLLSVRLSQNGWRRVFLNERLSIGRNVEGLADLKHQRERWHVGEMQVALTQWPAAGTPSAGRVKLRCVQSVLNWLADPTLSLLWLVVPTLYWFTGIALVRASAEDVLSYCLPMLLAPHAVIFWLTRGAVMPFGSQAEPLLLAPRRLVTGLSVLFGRGEPRRFVQEFVTPKGLQTRGVRVHVRTLAWTGALLLALVAGVLYRVFTPWPDDSAQAFLVWNAVATGMVIVQLWVMIVPCIERPRYRKAERYPHRGQVCLGQGGTERACTLHDLSLTGARISLASGEPLEGEASLVLSPQLEVRARVVRTTPSGHIGLELLPAPDQELMLIRFVLCSRTFVPQAERWSWWSFCGVLVRRLAGVRAAS